MTILLEKITVSMAYKKLFVSGLKKMVSLGGLEPPTSSLSRLTMNYLDCLFQLHCDRF